MKFLTTALFLASCFTSFAKEGEAAKIDLKDLKHPVKSALWKIEGKGLKKPSYLFGTIHLGDPRVTTLHPDAEAAFKAADAFYAEIDLDPKKQMQLATLILRKDGTTLSQSIGPKMTKELNAALADINPSMSVDVFDTMKTWFLAITLPVLKHQLAGEKPLDVALYERAQKSGKKIGALETAESQLTIFDSFKEGEQKKFLESTLKLLKKHKAAKTAPLDDILDAYLAKDIRAIAKVMKEQMEEEQVDKDLNKRLMKKILDDRNVTMTEAIQKLLTAEPEQSHFFAIGAAHYTGKHAIQDLLTKKGYTITPAFK